jgi:hypothetical protein
MHVAMKIDADNMRWARYERIPRANELASENERVRSVALSSEKLQRRADHMDRSQGTAHVRT